MSFWQRILSPATAVVNTTFQPQTDFIYARLSRAFEKYAPCIRWHWLRWWMRASDWRRSCANINTNKIQSFRKMAMLWLAFTQSLMRIYVPTHSPIRRPNIIESISPMEKFVFFLVSIRMQNAISAPTVDSRLLSAVGWVAQLYRLFNLIIIFSYCCHYGCVDIVVPIYVIISQLQPDYFQNDDGNRCSKSSMCAHTSQGCSDAVWICL